MKTTLAIAPDKVINVYVTTFPDITKKGTSTFPYNNYALWNNNAYYGVIIRPTVFPGSNDPRNYMGMVLVHEIGHILGLKHTFWDFDCRSGDPDECPDTPAHLRNFYCDGNEKACDGQTPAPVNNYMNYVEDQCMSKFTPNQKQLMNQKIQQYRPNIGGTTLAVNNDITIIAGSSLQLMGSTTLNFAAGKKIVNYGSLSCSNVTMTSSSSWGGIQFNSGSSGSLNSCTISNVLTYGGAAISINNASPTINNCTISNNSSITSGVSLFNSSGATLTNNNISSSSSYVLYFYNSNGYLTGNTITGGGTYTVYCFDHSTPWFAPYGTGNNVIQGGTHGVYAYYYSTPSLSSGNNSIWNNSTYQAAAYSSSVIYANSVCWGTQNPVIYWDGGSTINWLNPLQCSSPKIVGGGNKTSKMPIVFVNDDNAAKAHDLRLNARYNEAVNICKNIINTKENTTEATTALIELGFIYKENKDKSIIDFIKNIALDKKDQYDLKPAALSTLSNIYYENHEYVAAVETTERLIKQYPGTVNEKAANLNLVYLYASTGANDLAKKAIANFKKKYTDDENILAAEWFLMSHTETTSAKEQNNSALAQKLQSEEYIETDELVSNYPNPFNPTTQIRFTLEESSKISLKVYDVLGKEVANLAEGFYEAGKHTATFDGSNLASGLYLYQLTTMTATITKKMILTK